MTELPIDEVLAFDIETYPNCMCFGFKSNDSDYMKVYSVYGANSTLSHTHRQEILQLFKTNRIVTFNGRAFDIPLTLGLIKHNWTSQQLARKVQILIEKQIRCEPKILKLCGISKIPNLIDHWDMMNCLLGTGGLKAYMARMGFKTLQELPYEPNTNLSKSEFAEIVNYNVNDLDGTLMCYNKANDTGEISTRLTIIETSSLSDDDKAKVKCQSSPNIAESILVNALNKKGIDTDKPKYFKSVKLELPKYLNQLQHPDNIKALKFFKSFKYTLDKNKVKLPTKSQLPKVSIAGTDYTIGSGGLHSKEDSLCVVSTKGKKLRNADVASYYPASIIIHGAFRREHHNILHPLYKGFRDRRVKIKKTHKDESLVLKLFLNGTFGKLGEVYSKIYNPAGMLKVTVTGQLSLLLLIEWLESANISVFSANTDGVEYHADDSEFERAKSIIAKWEQLTGYVMEHGTYLATYNSSVNSYLAIYDGYIKGKGVYPELAYDKYPQYKIVFTAIREHLLSLHTQDVPKCPYKIIDDCDDIREFVVVTNVTGGATFKGKKVGKTVRFYYTGDESNWLMNKKGDRVRYSLTAKPIMNFDDNYSLPADLDKDYYKQLVEKHLTELGYYNTKVPNQLLGDSSFD